FLRLIDGNTNKPLQDFSGPTLTFTPLQFPFQYSESSNSAAGLIAVAGLTAQTYSKIETTAYPSGSLFFKIGDLSNVMAPVGRPVVPNPLVLKYDRDVGCYGFSPLKVSNSNYGEQYSTGGENNNRESKTATGLAGP